MNDEEQLQAWMRVADDQQEIGVELWEATRSIEVLSNDPRAMSCQLFSRLWSNARSFNLLFRDNFINDAEIILRAGIEASICISNLKIRPNEFMADVKADAANTLAGQIPIWTKDDPAFHAEALATANEVFGAPPNGKKRHPRLEMEVLAEQASVWQLYSWHKHLSGTAAHVTGLSLLQYIEVGDGWPREWKSLRRAYSLGMACCVFQVGATAHAEMIEAEVSVQRLAEMTERITILSAANSPSD